MSNLITNLQRKAYYSHRTYSSDTCSYPTEALNTSSTENGQQSLDSGAKVHLSMQALPKKVTERTGSSTARSQLQSRASTSATLNGALLLNRKLIRGYSKFLSEKDFINRREDEKLKIQEDLKKVLKGSNQTIISDDIQRLITSTVVNDTYRRPRTVMKSSESLYNSDQVNKYDEKHKQVCNRILGGDFEDNLLFIKMHEENVHIKPYFGLKSSNLAIKHDTSINTRKPSHKVSSLTTERKFRVSSSEAVPSNLSVLLREKDERNNDPKSITIDENDCKLPSVIHLGSEFMTKETEHSERMNTYSNEVGIILNQRVSSTRKPNDINDLHQKAGKRKSQFENNESFTANLHKNLKATAEIKKSNKRLPSHTQENIDVGTIKRPNSNTSGDYNFSSIQKINTLCDRAIRSTSKLSNKLSNQHLKAGKEFGRLDVKIEKLNYENTIQNWEKSVKQASTGGHKRKLFF